MNDYLFQWRYIPSHTQKLSRALCSGVTPCGGSIQGSKGQNVTGNIARHLCALASVLSLSCDYHF